MINTIKRTPFFNHITRDFPRAFFAPFAGWDMPVYLTTIKEEHHAVRTDVGMFDISHMGLIFVDGEASASFFSNLVSNDICSVPDGKAVYTPLCNPQGGIIDDVIVCKKNTSSFVCIVNAGNVEKVWAWMQTHCVGKSGVHLENGAGVWAGLAIQGPRSLDVMQSLVGGYVSSEKDERRATSEILSSLQYYTFASFTHNNRNVFVGRFGYTGEKGYELWFDARDSVAFVDTVWTACKQHGVRVCGLGARDVLRIEAGYPLYGHELDEETTPFEADISWTVKCDSHTFIGKEALCTARNVPRKKLVGLVLNEPQLIPRQGYAVFDGEKQIGTITSGTLSFTRNTAVACAYVLPEYAVRGNHVTIAIRTKRVAATIVKKQFYYNAAIKM